MSYISLLQTHRASIGFGFVHAFFSGFGQTFLIALFAPYLMAEFSLSHSTWGLLYSLATLSSAFIFPWLGSLIDDMPLARFSGAASLLLALASVVLGMASSIYWLLVALLALRLGGQALMAHITATAVARSFGARRGRALSLAMLGHPAAEALLPLVMLMALGALGWRATSFAMAGLSLLVLLPVSQWLLTRADRLQQYAPVRDQQRRFLAFGLLLKPPLLLVWPAAVLSPFVLTGIFLHQEAIVAARHEPAGSFAAFFVAFAAARTVTTFVGGRWVDSWSARRLFPFYLAPLTVGLLVLLIVQHRFAMPVFLLGAGLTVGAGTIVKSALWAELYPSHQLGKVRSVLSMVSVFSTALSPALFGACLDYAAGARWLLLGCIVALVVGTGLSALPLLIWPPPVASR